MRATLRAPRIVVIFEGGPEWRDEVARALYDVGRIWGGQGFLLIPHHDGEVAKPLRQMAVHYDPDFVVAMRHPPFAQSPDPDAARDRARAAQAARKQIVDDCSPHRISLPREDAPAGLDASNFRFHEPTRNLGVGRGGFFVAVDQMRGKDDPEPAGVPGDKRGSWALSAALRIGFRNPPGDGFAAASVAAHDEDPVPEVAAAALRYNSPLRGLDFPHQPSWSSAWLASETGLTRLQDMGATMKPHLVVMGDSPDDFALALGWDRMFGRARWLPEPELPRGALDGTMDHLAFELSGGELDEDRSVIWTSCTVSEASLQASADRLAEREPRVFVGSEFVSEGADVSSSADPASERDTVWEIISEASVSVSSPSSLEWRGAGFLAVRGEYDRLLALPSERDDKDNFRLLVDLPAMLPDSDLLSTVDGSMSWQVDLRFEDATPRARGLNSQVLQMARAFPELVRASREGLTINSKTYGFRRDSGLELHQLAHPRLQVPGLMGWVQSMVGDHDLSAGFSDAGQRIEILRRTWGSRDSLARDWAGNLRVLLLAFERDGKSTALAYPDGEGVYLAQLGGLLTFDGMTKVMGVDSDDRRALRALRTDVDRLAASRVLTRGLVLGCESCAVVQFVTLDALGQSYRCNRCNADNELQVNRWTSPRGDFDAEPAFYYDLHPVARQLMRADTGVALLLSEYLQRSARSYVDVSEMEFFKHDKRFVEIDLIACADDRVILAEAKKTPSLGSVAERTRKAKNLARLAAILRADEVVLCTVSRDEWKNADVDAVRAALRHTYVDKAREPLVRTIKGLGSEDVVDRVAEGHAPS